MSAENKPDNLPETRPQETAPQNPQSLKKDSKGQPAGERAPNQPTPDEVRAFLHQENKNPDDFE